jgi:hypothetical protein
MVSHIIIGGVLYKSGYWNNWFLIVTPVIGITTFTIRRKLKPTKSKISMWTTDSLWFEIAIVSMIFAIGNMVMGQFEERTPKVRRVGKYLSMLVIICGISVLFGRSAAMITLAVFFLL